MSSADPFAYYRKITNNLYNTFGVMLLCAGSVGGVLNCVVFAQKTMRKNPGSIYFLAFNIINVFALYSTLFMTLLISLFHVDPTILSTVGCKIYYYIRTLATILSSYYLVLASIDRALFTSRNASTRQRSTHRLAYRSIAGVTIPFCLYYIQTLVFADVYPLFPGFYLCYYRPGTYRSFSSFNSLVLSAFVPLLLLSVFGVLTLKNLYRNSVQPAVANGPTAATTPRPNRNRQLAVMLLVEIVIYMCCSLTILNFNIYVQITQNQIKNAQQQALEQLLLALFFLLSCVPEVTSFYVYLAVSRTFRQQTRKILFKLCHCPPILNGQN